LELVVEIAAQPARISFKSFMKQRHQQRTDFSKFIHSSASTILNVKPTPCLTTVSMNSGCSSSFHEASLVSNHSRCITEAAPFKRLTKSLDLLYLNF
jgi:hypothetical protein